MALTDKLTSIADAIRTKNGTSAKLSLDDMASSILSIESGSGIDTSDATATADDIIASKTAYVNGEKITGNIVRYNGTTYTPTTEDELFPAGAYNSKIIVKGDANLLPENIRQGVSIFNVEGTLSPYEDTDSTATAENIESGYTAYVKGEQITGSLETGVQANLLANSTTYSNEGSVKYSKSTGMDSLSQPSCFTVSYENRNKRIAKVNDKISANVRASLFGNANVNDVAKGKTFSSENGLKLTGTYEGSTPTLQEKTITPSEESQSVTPDSGYGGLSQVTVDAISSTYVGSGVTKKSATTYTPGTSDQTIASGQYLNGAQTIKGDANLVAGNIKSGVSIFGVSGSYAGSGGSSGGLDTSDATATAGDIVSGKTAYVNAEKITGTLSTLNVAPGTPEYNTSPDQIIISTSLTERYIVENTVSLTAKASDFGDAVPSDVVSGKTFTSASGLKLTGTREGSGGSSGGLVIKSGTTTSATIETGLSSIKILVIYTDSFRSTGFIQGTYVADEGIMHYTYCSSYSSYMKVCGVTTSNSCTVNGGTFTLNASHGLINGKTYNWIAVGEA